MTGENGTYACVFTHTHVHMFSYIDMLELVSIFTRMMKTGVYTYDVLYVLYVCMHVCMHAWMHVCMYVCMYACMHGCM